MLRSRLRNLPCQRPSACSVPAPDLLHEDVNTEINESLEDIFEASRTHLFPDNPRLYLGGPGEQLLYNTCWGDLTVMVPTYPSLSDQHLEENDIKLTEKDGQPDQVNQARKLFAHYLWNGALVVAEGVEDAYSNSGEANPKQEEAREIWQGEGERVLELGAGAALPSLICALAKAATVVATDHPVSPALGGAITFNMDHNLRNRPELATAHVSTHPHEWGLFSDSFSQQNQSAFTRIIATDCFWLHSQHENLARSLQWFLAPGGKVWVVSELYVGRQVVAGFFETVLGMGFEIESISERDLAAYMDCGIEIRREWVPGRESDDSESWRRWCVVAILKWDARF
ncbi:uncharacterized protein ASPGLDRAFT_53583 [Aspergillus glaucus CBS 516.65]|uniref:Uncharacterized protein n=1 Tax=Aspergillus glaucus CBS 516.65 TaxID=1160497 RepID=A0A1L9V3X2_ASPGL|nr:hypothetical protein ASPGLDRAFT_53583 [Aspergillus glaucus CBS 516.65]OJJ78539.1 hypothetical protein ASPGLDRAFT_53583 [Aspergillus glaucus CBS 516.65]